MKKVHAELIQKTALDLMQLYQVPGIIALYYEGPDAEAQLMFAHAGMDPKDALKLVTDMKKRLETGQAGDLDPSGRRH